MLHFLQEHDSSKHLISGVEQVKEKLVEEQYKLTSFFDHFFQSLIELTPKVLSAILVLIVGMWLIKRIAVVAEKTMARRELEVSLRTFLKSLVSIGLKIILIVTVAGMLGIGTASFVTILGAAGLAVGLALQGSLSNFAGGVLILIFKPFRVEDSIEAQGQIGTVREIQIFNTILLTGDNKTVILPNGPLSNGTIVNRSRYGNLRIDVALEISNENDIEKVKGIIYAVLKGNDKVLPFPEPGIFIGQVSDGAAQINVRPFCLPAHTTLLTSELYYQIYSAFEKNAITLPPKFRLIKAN
jgi:small conductance mechanosensitive channel